MNFGLSEKTKRILSKIEKELAENWNQKNSGPIVKEIHPSNDIILDDDDIPF